MTPSFHRLQEWHEKHECVISLVSFFGGFAIDNLSLLRIDRSFDNFILFGWLFVAGAGIVLLNLSFHGMARGRFFERSDLWLPIVIQFAFGALFSGFTIFYMRSGTFIHELAVSRSGHFSFFRQ